MKQAMGVLAEALRHQNALQSALDLIDQGFTLIDEELRLVAWNAPFLRLLGFPDRLAYRGAPFEGFIRFNAERGEYGPGEVEEQVNSRLAAARHFSAHDFTRTRPDGTVLRVRGFPVPRHGFVTLYSDISAQQAAEQEIQAHAAALESRVAERTGELRRREAQLRLITDSIPALIAYVDQHRTYRYINRGYQLWFGLDPAHPEAVSAREFLGEHTYASIRPYIARAFAGEAVTFEYEVQVQGGRRLQARTSLIPDMADNAAPVGCYELTFDITEQKLAQAMLVQAQKMEALGQLTGGLAHDFNNILTVVMGNLQALVQARPQDAAVTEYVEPALEAARRGVELIKGLLSFSRTQALQTQATELGGLLQSVARLVRPSLPESLHLEVDTGAAPVWADIDRHQLENSLLNLIINARDALAGPGQVRLQVRQRWLRTPEAAELGLPEGPCADITVQDDGCGMDAPTLARVFEPFFTTKRPGAGTGLGLAMVYGFVKQSGGAVTIRSQPGQGCTVSLYLPALADAAVGERADAQALPAPARAPDTDLGLALLVEDDPDVRSVVRRALLGLGYVVLEAEHGAEALQILAHTPDIALVLTDVVMPGGVDGRAVAHHARQHCGVPKVALMSGYAPQVAGDNDGLPILAKPFTPQQLAQWLASLPS